MTQKEKALDILKHNELAKLEHLLAFDVFDCEGETELLDFIKKFSNDMWNYHDITISYQGYATYNDKICEIYFRSDKVITKDQFEDCTQLEDCDVTFFGVNHKTMVIDEIDEIYENVEHHWSIDSMQDLYGYTDAEMYEIFKDADLAEMFMSKS